MRTPKRIWRTLGGDLVPEGHPAAAYLVYGVDDEVENRDAEKVAAILEPPAAPTKQAPKPRDKKAPAAADK